MRAANFPWSVLAEAWGQQFIVDNRAGAGGAVGAGTVAKGVPDGYTLLVVNLKQIQARQD